MASKKKQLPDVGGVFSDYKIVPTAKKFIVGMKKERKDLGWKK
jgi:hypothetical protein